MSPSASSRLPTLSATETLSVLTDVIAPTIAKGVIIRRPAVVGVAERLELDRRAVRRLQELRNRYGRGPVLLRVPVRNQAVILDPEDVFRVLDESPAPFSTASSEKRAALRHLEPHGALITPPGPARSTRRRFNEVVLETDNPMHTLSERFIAVVEEEAAKLLKETEQRDGTLAWGEFIEGWFRIVRRVVLGDAARDDREMRRLTDELRSDANWAFAKPRRNRVRRDFFTRLNRHLARAEPGSLAAVVASIPKTRETAPDHQVPQWLFAFDPAGMATFRALGLLASHPVHAEAARREFAQATASGDHHLPYLRACVLEALRLWPTTPAVLRQTTRETEWDTGTMPAGTGVLIYAPFFHRDDQRLRHADHFAPEAWLAHSNGFLGDPPRPWPLIPFSGGPAICPGRHLVLLLTSHLLGNLLEGRSIQNVDPERLRPGRLPGTLNNYSLRFRVGDG